MQKNADGAQNGAVYEAMKLASTPAGQNLITRMRAQSGDAFDSAIAKAAMGDYLEAKKLLSSFMNTAEAKALLDQLGR